MGEFLIRCWPGIKGLNNVREINESKEQYLDEVGGYECTVQGLVYFRFSASFLSKTLETFSNAVIGKMGSKERRFTLLVNFNPVSGHMAQLLNLI